MHVVSLRGILTKAALGPPHHVSFLVDVHIEVRGPATDINIEHQRLPVGVPAPNSPRELLNTLRRNRPDERKKPKQNKTKQNKPRGKTK